MLHFFFFNDTATTEIYTLSLHDALPICERVDARDHAGARDLGAEDRQEPRTDDQPQVPLLDRKSTRMNSSHLVISYAVFCLKKKKLQSYLRFHSRSSEPSQTGARAHERC